MLCALFFFSGDSYGKTLHQFLFVDVCVDREYNCQMYGGYEKIGEVVNDARVRSRGIGYSFRRVYRRNILMRSRIATDDFSLSRETRDSERARVLERLQKKHPAWKNFNCM